MLRRLRQRWRRRRLPHVSAPLPERRVACAAPPSPLDTLARAVTVVLTLLRGGFGACVVAWSTCWAIRCHAVRQMCIFEHLALPHAAHRAAPAAIVYYVDDGAAPSHTPMLSSADVAEAAAAASGEELRAWAAAARSEAEALLDQLCLHRRQAADYLSRHPMQFLRSAVDGFRGLVGAMGLRISPTASHWALGMVLDHAQAARPELIGYAGLLMPSDLEATLLSRLQRRRAEQAAAQEAAQQPPQRRQRQRRRLRQRQPQQQPPRPQQQQRRQPYDVAEAARRRRHARRLQRSGRQQQQQQQRPHRARHDEAPTALPADAQPLLPREASGLGRSPTCSAYDGPPVAATGDTTPPATLVAELVATIAEQPLPTDAHDASAAQYTATRTRVRQLAAALGAGTHAHKEETVRALHAVLLRLAHASSLPSNKAAHELLGVAPRVFTRWNGKVLGALPDDALANAGRARPKRGNNQHGAAAPPGQRARHDDGGASSSASAGAATAATSALLTPDDLLAQQQQVAAAYRGGSEGEALAACLQMANAFQGPGQPATSPPPPSMPPSPPASSSARSCGSSARSCGSSERGGGSSERGGGSAATMGWSFSQLVSAAWGGVPERRSAATADESLMLSLVDVAYSPVGEGGDADDTHVLSLDDLAALTADDGAAAPSDDTAALHVSATFLGPPV